MSGHRSAPWRALSDQYQALVDHPPIDAAAVWRLFVEDPWYRHELHRTASWIARRTRLPHCEADDLCHEAMLILRRRLARRPDLRINRALAADHFGAWLRRVIRRHCLDAVRRSGVSQHTCESLPQDDVLAEPSVARWLVELREEIESLPAPERSVVVAYCAGGSLTEAAAMLGTNYHRARRALRSGVARLRRCYEQAPAAGGVPKFFEIVAKNR